MSDKETVDEQQSMGIGELVLLVLAFNSPLLVILVCSLFMLWS